MFHNIRVWTALELLSSGFGVAPLPRKIPNDRFHTSQYDIQVLDKEEITPALQQVIFIFNQISSYLHKMPLQISLSAYNRAKQVFYDFTLKVFSSIW